MQVPIGQCSRCGGSVLAFRGPWMSVNPPPEPQCSSCGARPQKPVIQMGKPIAARYDRRLTE